MDRDNNFGSVKVVMKRKTPIQLFRILLVNKGEMPISINFSSLEDDKLLTFYVKTPNMYIDAGQRSILEIKAVHKYNKVKSDEKWKDLNCLKLLFGKIKDCELKFSLIVDVIIIN